MSRERSERTDMCNVEVYSQEQMETSTMVIPVKKSKGTGVRTKRCKLIKSMTEERYGLYFSLML